MCIKQKNADAVFIKEAYLNDDESLKLKRNRAEQFFIQPFPIEKG